MCSGALDQSAVSPLPFLKCWTCHSSPLGLLHGWCVALSFPCCIFLALDYSNPPAAMKAHTHSHAHLPATRLCRNVCHRDLKLENLLLATPDDITKVSATKEFAWRPCSNQPNASGPVRQCCCICNQSTCCCFSPALKTIHRGAILNTSSHPTPSHPTPTHPVPLVLQVKIADFGLAKRSAGAMSTVCGTPQYVAPEVIQGTATVEYGPAVR